MMPWIQMLVDALDNLGSWIAFAYVLLGGFAMLCIVALFGALLIRGIWRWATRGSWNDVVVAGERKAFR